MAIEASQLHQAARETLHEACKTPEGWMRLLKSIAPFYKYDFENALLISSQRPDAAACATMRQWNGLNLWIRKGSKAIYALDPNNPYAVQRVFDISDINAPPERKPSVWSLREEMLQQVFSSLRERWQTRDMPGEYALQLYEVITEAAAERIAEFRNDFEDARSESFMSEMDAEAAESLFLTLAVNSAFYIAVQKLGLPVPEDIDAEIMEDIRYFDTWATQMAIGEAAHEVAETVLRQIERLVKGMEQVNSPKPLDKRGAEWNNGDGIYSQSQSIDSVQEKLPETAEEGEDHDGDEVAGDSVRGGGGRDARPGAGIPEAAGGQRGQVRRDAAGVSATAPEGDLRDDASGRHAEAAPDGRERASEADGRAADRADAENRPRPRQSDAAARLGSAYEQPEGAGRGDRQERIDLRIAAERQQNHAKEPSQASGSFSFPGEQQLSLFGAPVFDLPQQVIDQVLVDGSNQANSRFRIVARFKKDLPIEDNADFLWREYLSGGKGFILDGRRMSVWWDAEGIRIAEGDTAWIGSVTVVSWERAARRIRELLDDGRYMSQVDLDLVDHMEMRELAQRLWYAYTDDFPAFPEEWRVGRFPESTALIAELLSELSSRVQIILKLESDVAALDAGQERRRGWHDVHRLLDDVKSLERIPLGFTARTVLNLAEKRFITQDEVDADLTRGTGYENGKIRVFRYFQQTSAEKDRVGFLKDAYGTGGHSHALSDADDSDEEHGAKGIVLSRGSLTQPYAKVTLSWPHVARRIGELIDSGRYLSPKDMEQLRQEESVSVAIEPEKAEAVPVPTQEKAYDLGFGLLGNGTTVWNRLEEENHDYKTVAHIGEDGHVTLYEQDMPQDVLDSIYAQAERDKAPVRTPTSTQAEPSDREQGDPKPDPEIEPDDSTEVIVAMAEYNRHKELHPEHIVLVQVGDHYETYGEDAVLVAPILKSNLLERAIPGSGSVKMTGFDPASAWPSHLMALWSKGHSVLLMGLDEQGRYGMIKERTAAEYAPVGAQFTLDGHEFRVDSVDFMSGRATLQDLTMFASVYPLFRSEPLDLVHELIAEQANREAERFVPVGTYADEPGFVPNGTGDAPSLAGNYRIHDDHLGEGGQRTKADRNIEAIRTLKSIEGEFRNATAAEHEILAQYVGWGGIPQIFDEEHTDWKERREVLRGLLTPDEYTSARASTLNAHYTSPTVIRAIYQGLANLGFQQGNILEPACGIGNFFGMLPEQMAESKLYGVELDSVTGRIAQKLYPEAKIGVHGFEYAALPDSFFDAAVGNVPFGAYSLADPKYDRYHFRIHDYFFAKAIDKVRPGGVVAFVTSKGTMDKQDSSVRRYIAQRAELLGAIRLPNMAFKANAGTEVTTDILFFQKRERPIETEPDWLHVSRTLDGVPVNQYFLDHPGMLLGRMVFDKSMYGNEQDTACEAFPDANLAEELAEAIPNIRGLYEEQDIDEPSPDESRTPADPTVPNFSFAVQDGRVYFRRDHWTERCDFNTMDDKRVRGMIHLRDLTRELIQAQLAGAPDEAIHELQVELNERYDSFTRQYDLLSSRRNASVFDEDDGYYLLTSLEILDDERKLERKADMFTKRTIAQSRPVEHVGTAPEALAVSMAERARVDLNFMSELTGMDRDKLIADLTGLIFQSPFGNPGPYDNWQTADEYLSGDVRQKLRVAESAVAALSDRYAVNVAALKAVQPKDLEPQEIDVRLGATWIPARDITDFTHQLLNTPHYMRWKIKTEYVPATGAWHIENKGLDGNNPFANTQYGTDYRSGYKIIEESLNLRDVRVYDTVEDEYGNQKRVLNQKQTILAQQKQTAIQEAFRDWIWKEPRRRERLCRLYNDTYNCIRPREYDGSHLRFSGMNPELNLRPHQKNAVARILYGGNTLLAHTVGAGKTAVMVASLMEKVRIGLGHKALIAVPNHLTEQTAAEFLRFFPAAKVLVATRKDFEKQNRKRFMGRIATGDYDAIIMGHSQFEKIPVSQERQKRMLEDQIQEIMEGIQELKDSRGERFSIKELERTKKALEARLKKLNSEENKDQVVTFEELGVDMLYVDEAHGFKNLAVVTKMRNVAGINTTEAKKSSDMYMKCRYLSEITGDRGVVFATGTPISNSMTELYTMQRYLQHTELSHRGLSHFDSWAANFGETQTAIELAPEGTGYRLKTRFSKFFNLPELMSMFKQVADIQTPDMLNLPIPELKGGKTLNIKTEACEYQKEMVRGLAERADAVRGGNVDPREDNMLKITNDGRLLALDARLIDPTLPDDPDSKVNACVREVLRIHEEGGSERLTQLIFCDLSTPKVERADGSFDDVYHDLKRKLIRAGVPEQEIAFIHDANTETQKDELFAKVRKGAMRILIGSTPKMGAGTNVQKQLKALHHLDCPWRPSDLQQRDGRILRQGNENLEVEVIRYITQDTFDAYSYQLVENKQKFISQIFTSKSPVRGAEDLDEMALSYAEVKALAAGNPAIREKMDLDVQVSRLKLLKGNWQSERYRLERKVNVELPGEIARLEHRIKLIAKDIARYEQHKPPSEDGFSITMMDRPYDKRADAGERLMNLLALVPTGDSMKVGQYCGFDLRLRRPDMLGAPRLEIDGEGSYAIELGDSALGNIQRLENLAKGLATQKEQDGAHLDTAKNQMAGSKAELEKPWAQETELQEKSERLTQLNIELNVGGSDASAAAFADGDERDDEEDRPAQRGDAAR